MLEMPKPSYEAWRDSMYDMPIEDVEFTTIDTETTGLSPAAGHRICQVAIVKSTLHGTPRVLRSLVNPCRACDPEAERVHGLYKRILDTAPKFGSVAKTVAKQLEFGVLVGHNVAFDLRFLAAEWRRLCWDPPYTIGLDTLALIRNTVKPKVAKLSVVAQLLDIPLTNAHAADHDALATWEVLRAILLERELYELKTLGDMVKLQGGPKDWPAPEWGHLPAVIQQALREHLALTLTYRNKQGGVKTFPVNPVDATSKVLIATGKYEGEYMTLSLESILEVRLSRGECECE